ncbi:MAG: NAD(P)/FAD-dependent oxidoreductase [Acidobacteria bacterium]|nr:NAD(P)/FAD-dependent oxidoreductase [Acidobacteriota bacterium]
MRVVQSNPVDPQVLILGSGFGGLEAGKVFRGKPVGVTILDRHNYHLFQPLLYQVATATLSPGDIASPIRWIFRRAANVRVLLGEATAIDAANHRVQLADGAALDYDFLIVATGASHTYFGHDDWGQHAPGLKTLEDALHIRRRILLAFERAERESDPATRQELLTFVLVGGGPTGVELAGTLAEIARHTLRHEFRSIDPSQARIIVIEAGPTILSAFPEGLRDAARASLRRLRVEVREGAAVTGVDAGGVTLGAERIAAATVLWTAGVAASPLVRSLGAPLDRAGRVLVQPDLSVPGYPEVFVVGDAAAYLDDNGKALPGVAHVAMQQATHAARGILGRLNGSPSKTFVYRGLGNMAIVGRGSAVADLGWVRFSGITAWFSWLFLHIVQLIGFRNRLLVLVQWAVAFVTFQRSVRLITNDEGRSDRS